MTAAHLALDRDALRAVEVAAAAVLTLLDHRSVVNARQQPPIQPEKEQAGGRVTPD